MRDDQILEKREITIATKRSGNRLQPPDLPANRLRADVTDRTQAKLEANHPLSRLMKTREIVIFSSVLVKTSPMVPPCSLEPTDHKIVIDLREVCGVKLCRHAWNIRTH